MAASSETEADDGGSRPSGAGADPGGSRPPVGPPGGGTPLSSGPRFLPGLLLLLLLFVGLQWFQRASRGLEIPYAEFKTLLRAGAIKNVVISDVLIAGEMSLSGADGALPQPRLDSLRAGGDTIRVFETVRVEDPDLIKELEAANVSFEGRPPTPWFSILMSWVVPFALLFLLWAFLLRRFSPQQGLLSIGKSRARLYRQESTGVTFQDVAGIEEAKAELVEIVDFLKHPDRYRRLGGSIPKGVLLVGAPGTGKTLLARAVAGEAGVPFFSLTGSEFVEMFVGVGAARVRDLFDQAGAAAPSIIFIDELDALGRMRVGGQVVGSNEEREQTLNQLLAEMDGFDSEKGLIIMAATNRPEILDPALMRPGRFDRKVVLERPDIKGREEILRLHAREVVLSPDVDLTAVAARTPGFVGAELANVVNEAALHAARTGKDAVTMEDFDEAVERVVAGLEHRSRVMNPKEKLIVAHHEAGHALVAEMRPTADRVAKISIIPRGIGALGYTRQQPTEDRYLLTRAELVDRLDVLLGGRGAEMLVFGDVSTGAVDDLQRATDLARDMVSRFGMSEEIGPMALEEPRRAGFLDVPVMGPREFSESTAQEIDRAVRALLEESQERVLTSLRSQRATLEALAALLMEREAVDRAMLVELLERSGRQASGAPARSLAAP